MKSNTFPMQPEIIKPNLQEEFLTPEHCHILELWNTEKDPSVSIARARVLPGIMTQLHKIAGIVERYIIIQGKGEVRVGGMATESVGPPEMLLSSRKRHNNKLKIRDKRT